MSETIKIIADNRERVFQTAYNGSYYTILGCAGELSEWTAGYRQLLESQGIGTPQIFFSFKGRDMNEFYGLTGDNAYQDELTGLMFPLDGLDVCKLALFKLKAGDSWFDDIVDNNQRRQRREIE